MNPAAAGHKVASLTADEPLCSKAVRQAFRQDIGRFEFRLRGHARFCSSSFADNLCNLARVVRVFITAGPLCVNSVLVCYLGIRSCECGRRAPRISSTFDPRGFLYLHLQINENAGILIKKY